MSRAQHTACKNQTPANAPFTAAASTSSNRNTTRPGMLRRSVSRYVARNAEQAITTVQVLQQATSVSCTSKASNARALSADEATIERREHTSQPPLQRQPRVRATARGLRPSAEPRCSSWLRTTFRVRGVSFVRGVSAQRASSGAAEAVPRRARAACLASAAHTLGGGRVEVVCIQKDGVHVRGKAATDRPVCA
jgi:hypothetical protein